MKTALAVFDAMYICPNCSGTHLTSVAARDMTDAFQQMLKKDAISFSLRAPISFEVPPMHPTIFYRSGNGKINAQVFGEGATAGALDQFSMECVRAKTFVGLLTDRQAIYQRP